MEDIEKVINQLEEYIWEDNNWSELSNIRDKLKRFIQEYKQSKMNNESLQLQYDALLDSKEIDYKEAEDALCVLLHCSLKDTEYDTQKAQFGTVLSYIERLEKENKELSIIKRGIQVMESNFANADTYYLIAKPNFLKSDYKKLLDDYIPKSEIRDKLEELEEDNYDGEQYQMCIEAKIDILKEILGGKIK